MPLPERKYPRAKFHNYNGGDYFVTVCTHNKKHYFGSIHGNEMILSKIGIILYDTIQAVSRHFNDVEIPLFVVMPNHFHAIVCIYGEKAGSSNCNHGSLAELAKMAIKNGDDPEETTHHNSRLATVVGCIKANVTRRGRDINPAFKWQSRFHDHIIRGRHDGNKIAEYIETNVARWAVDCFHQD